MAESEVVAAGVTLDLGDPTLPISRRLMAALRDAVRAGRLQPGSALPPSRLLAAELGCSRWVVTEAYGQLVTEGYLVATTGSATRVRELSAAAPVPRIRPIGPPRRARFDLAPGIGDLAAFPRSRWAEAYRQAVQHRQTDQLAGITLASTSAARTVLTDYLRRTRDIREDPMQLSLSTGSAAAAGWLARLLVGAGHRRVAVEDPSWPGLRDAARWAGLRPVGIEVDDQGLRVDRLARDPELRVVIVTPAHQFPTGVAMSADRRLQLIDWAERVDGLIIEDDYDAEFRYDRRPVASLQGMAPGRVALLGSVSKTLSPAVGLGWVVLPPWLIDHLITADLDRGVGPSVFAVDALVTMIANGGYERHLRAARLRYRRRRESLLAAVAEHLPDCRPSGMAAGMHLLLRLPAGVSAAAVVDLAAERDVTVADLGRYRVQPGPSDTLVIGYGNLRSGRERQAVGRLAAAIGDAG